MLAVDIRTPDGAEILRDLLLGAGVFVEGMRPGVVARAGFDEASLRVKIVDGKQYLTHTTRSLAAWQQSAAENIKRADQNWPTVERQAEPAIVGPPCRDRPPSVVISFNDGARRLLVGGQAAIDNNGNIVGKNDMRAQIEQVGKNIDACLKAAGANPSDVILTRAYVSDADAFTRNADVLGRYLGLQSLANAVNQVPLAAGPDFLVEIEAVANLNSSAAASTEPLRANQ